MEGDLTVSEQVIDQSTKLSPRGDIVPIMRVRFRIGDHGPFTLEFVLADFTPEKIKAAQDKIAATIRGL